jgi:cysteine-rich CPCC protein
LTFAPITWSKSVWWPAACHVELDDGRTLTVIYQGERYGWGAYVGGASGGPGSEQTPAAAMAAYLGWAADEIPAWARGLSEGWLRELREAPRFACDCCGYRTLLNTGRYEICPVCRWEDDRADRRRGDPDAVSGPNHISLTEARSNFAGFGACDEAGRASARDPRPDEMPGEETRAAGIAGCSRDCS